ncbi:MAG: hypothetical protein LUQ09_00175 [Methanomassiliicoccales archaeon]|nr:hypothetical protein [Methanomassiliicoccales archaeon]
MNLHPVTDDLADRFLNDLVDEVRPKRVEDVVRMLMVLPEYRHAASNNNPPDVYVGDRKRRAGEIVLEMTGGTAGPKKMYEKFADAGVGTVVFMHIPEGHLEVARDQHLNVVIAGHMATDSLGINLLADRSEEKGLRITPCSGLIRAKRM